MLQVLFLQLATIDVGEAQYVQFKQSPGHDSLFTIGLPELLMTISLQEKYRC